jgi:DNA-binding NtrC family response regulator
VFGIVKQNQGHIDVETEVDRGTTFKIYLPQAEAALTRPSEAYAPAEPDVVPSGTETILVVEDATDLRRLTVQTLKASGYRVLSARDGVDALEVSKRHKGAIHLLLTDLVMPQMGGRELVEILQPQRPEMQILYMSAYADRPLVRQAMSDPHMAFLPKPFTIEALGRKVRRILERRT